MVGFTSSARLAAASIALIGQTFLLRSISASLLSEDTPSYPEPTQRLYGKEDLLPSFNSGHDGNPSGRDLSPYPASQGILMPNTAPHSNPSDGFHKQIIEGLPTYVVNPENVMFTRVAVPSPTTTIIDEKDHWTIVTVSPKYGDNGAPNYSGGLGLGFNGDIARRQGFGVVRDQYPDSFRGSLVQPTVGTTLFNSLPQPELTNGFPFRDPLGSPNTAAITNFNTPQKSTYGDGIKLARSFLEPADSYNGQDPNYRFKIMNKNDQSFGYPQTLRQFNGRGFSFPTSGPSSAPGANQLSPSQPNFQQNIPRESALPLIRENPQFGSPNHGVPESISDGKGYQVIPKGENPLGQQWTGQGQIPVSHQMPSAPTVNNQNPRLSDVQNNPRGFGLDHFFFEGPTAYINSRNVPGDEPQLSNFLSQPSPENPNPTIAGGYSNPQNGSQNDRYRMLQFPINNRQSPYDDQLQRSGSQGSPSLILPENHISSNFGIFPNPQNMRSADQYQKLRLPTGNRQLPYESLTLQDGMHPSAPDYPGIHPGMYSRPPQPFQSEHNFGAPNADFPRYSMPVRPELMSPGQIRNNVIGQSRQPQYPNNPVQFWFTPKLPESQVPTGLERQPVHQFSNIQQPLDDQALEMMNLPMRPSNDPTLLSRPMQIPSQFQIPQSERISPEPVDPRTDGIQRMQPLSTSPLQLSQNYPENSQVARTHPNLQSIPTDYSNPSQSLQILKLPIDSTKPLVPTSSQEYRIFYTPRFSADGQIADYSNSQQIDSSNNPMVHSRLIQSSPEPLPGSLVYPVPDTLFSQKFSPESSYNYLPLSDDPVDIRNLGPHSQMEHLYETIEDSPARPRSFLRSQAFGLRAPLTKYYVVRPDGKVVEYSGPGGNSDFKIRDKLPFEIANLDGVRLPPSTKELPLGMPLKIHHSQQDSKWLPVQHRNQDFSGSSPLVKYVYVTYNYPDSHDFMDDSSSPEFMGVNHQYQQREDGFPVEVAMNNLPEADRPHNTHSSKKAGSPAKTARPRAKTGNKMNTQRTGNIATRSLLDNPTGQVFTAGQQPMGNPIFTSLYEPSGTLDAPSQSDGTHYSPIFPQEQPDATLINQPVDLLTVAEDSNWPITPVDGASASDAEHLELSSVNQEIVKQEILQPTIAPNLGQETPEIIDHSPGLEGKRDISPQGSNDAISVPDPTIKVIQPESVAMTDMDPSSTLTHPDPEKQIAGDNEPRKVEGQEVIIESGGQLRGENTEQGTASGLRSMEVQEDGQTNNQKLVRYVMVPGGKQNTQQHTAALNNGNAKHAMIPTNGNAQRIIMPSNGISQRVVPVNGQQMNQQIIHQPQQQAMRVVSPTAYKLVQMKPGSVSYQQQPGRVSYQQQPGRVSYQQQPGRVSYQQQHGGVQYKSVPLRAVQLQGGKVVQQG